MSVRTPPRLRLTVGRNAAQRLAFPRCHVLSAAQKPGGTACYDPGRCGEEPAACISPVLTTQVLNWESEEQMTEKKSDATNRPAKKLIYACIAVLLGAAGAAAQSTLDPLKSGFENPPESARPRVWWHWMNGNITQEGIKLDLEWMHRIGLGGFQNFDAALSTPQVVDKRLAYMTPDWKDAFKYATTLADQLDLEEAIAGSPGWSETGGPWVPPSQGMKKYVWSETSVEGGKPFKGALAKPPSSTGAFQSLGIHDLLPAPDGAQAVPQFYADTVVIAYRRAVSDVPVESLHPKVTASAGTPDAAMLRDGDLQKTTKLPIPKAGESAWIQYEYAEPQTMRSVIIVTKDVDEITAMVAGITNPEKSLEASDDGQNFRVIGKLPDSGAP